jgi:hypothetical protein
MMGGGKTTAGVEAWLDSNIGSDSSSSSSSMAGNSCYKIDCCSDPVGCLCAKCCGGSSGIGGGCGSNGSRGSGESLDDLYAQVDALQHLGEHGWRSTPTLIPAAAAAAGSAAVSSVQSYGLLYTVLSQAVALVAGVVLPACDVQLVCERVWDTVDFLPTDTNRLLWIEALGRKLAATAATRQAVLL